MPGNSWREIFSWRPSFNRVLTAFNRTGYFANDVLEPRLASQEKISPLLKTARSLTTLSAAAAVGLEIILHDVNVDDVPGVVTRINLPAALAKINHPIGPISTNTTTTDSPSSVEAAESYLDPIPSQEEEEEDHDEYNSEDDCPLEYFLTSFLSSVDIQDIAESHSHLVPLEENGYESADDSSLGESISLPSRHSFDSEIADLESIERAAALRLLISKSFGYKKPTWHDTFGAYQSITTTTSLPNRHFWGMDVVEKSVPFVTCKEATYGELMIPVPDSHAWRWFNMEEIDVFDEHLLGDGTFSNVYQASIAFFAENMEDYTVRSVAVKAFITRAASLDSVIYEADVSAYMASIGAGPDIVGLLKPAQGDDDDSLPSLLMVYIEQTVDLVTLFNGVQKPSRNIVIDILIQAARLLSVIHSHGFLHNDIKCCNMIATPNPQRYGAHHHGVPPPVGITGQLTPFSKYRVYLIDFGQTTYREGAVYRIPILERKKLGPYPYFPPEVFRGTPTSETSEVYSFGIMLKASCCFLMDDELRNDLSPIISQCLSPSPNYRPSMGEVEVWLAALLPPRWQKRFLKPVPSPMTSQKGSLTDTFSDACGSQSSGSSLGPFPSASTVPSSGSSSGFEIRVVSSHITDKCESSDDITRSDTETPVVADLQPESGLSEEMLRPDTATPVPGNVIPEESLSKEDNGELATEFDPVEDHGPDDPENNYLLVSSQRPGLETKMTNGGLHFGSSYVAEGLSPTSSGVEDFPQLCDLPELTFNQEVSDSPQDHHDIMMETIQEVPEVLETPEYIGPDDSTWDEEDFERYFWNVDEVMR